MFSRIPVRLRLSVGHALWMAIVFFAMGAGLFHIFKHNLYQSVDAALLSSAQSIRAARFDRGFNSPLMERFLHDFFGEKPIRPYAQLVDLSGKIREKTNQQVNLPVTRLALMRAEKGLESFETFTRQTPDAVPLRQVTLPVVSLGQFTGELVQVGASLDSPRHTLHEIALVLWLSLPFGLTVSIVFGYILTKRSLQPVVDMTERVSNLGSADLSVRLTLPPAHDELRRLAMTFNKMFGRLEDTFLRLRRFTGDVSHELRTPLAVMIGESELALRKERSSEDYQNALRAINREARYMQVVIEDLLLLARAESRAVAMSWQDVEWKVFLGDLYHMVKNDYASKNIELKISLPAQTRHFRGNPGFLYLALKNILLNAAKHSAPGSQVELVAELRGKRPTFIVIDYGEGIPEECLPYVFDPFYRADTARNRASGGSGIGLSLALALVRLHGGRIDAESKLGVGSTFTVTLGLPPGEKDVPSAKEVSPQKQVSQLGSLDPVTQG